MERKIHFVKTTVDQRTVATFPPQGSLLTRPAKIADYPVSHQTIARMGNYAAPPWNLLNWSK